MLYQVHHQDIIIIIIDNQLVVFLFKRNKELIQIKDKISIIIGAIFSLSLFCIYCP